MSEYFFGLQDVEVAQREGDAARRSLRDSKEAHVQALHAQSAAFDQTLDDAKTVAAQVLPVSPGQLPLLCPLAVSARPLPVVPLMQNCSFACCLNTRPGLILLRLWPLPTSSFSVKSIGATTLAVIDATSFKVETGRPGGCF